MESLNNKELLNMEEILPLLNEVISSGGEFKLFPRGTSMLPLLRQGVDSVILVSPSKIEKNDIVLYKRNNSQYVLHRVIKIKHKEYYMCGDNQYVLEKGIKEDQILAKVICIYKDNTRLELTSKEYIRYVKKLRSSRFKRTIKSKLRFLKKIIPWKRKRPS